jgi:hypothetical protein
MSSDSPKDMMPVDITAETMLTLTSDKMNVRLDMPR